MSAAPAPDPLNDAPPYAFQKVVYQNDSDCPDDRGYFERLMRNLAAHITESDGNVEIRVVSFSSGVKLFQLAKIDAGLAASLDALQTKGIHFLICRNTLKGMNLRLEDLYGVQTTDIVPSGDTEIARLQGLGFLYVHPRGLCVSRRWIWGIDIKVHGRCAARQD